MSFLEVLFLAIALSIDASVVSFSHGLVFSENKRKNCFYLALSVGIFQAIMPVIGWFAAMGIYRYVEMFANWIAFFIFLILGLKFINDALHKNDEQKYECCNLSLKYLLLISIATSIDALAAGATIYFLKSPILIPSLFIGIITFFNSIIGFWSGYIFKNLPSKYLEIFAGIILIILAVKTII